MTITRRNLLTRLVAATVSFPALSRIALAQTSVRIANAPATPLLLWRNENPYGPSQKVLDAIRQASSESNRYTDAECDALVSKLAVLHRVRPEQIVLGCGSSEILNLAAEEFLAAGKKLVQASPTCPLPAKMAEDMRAEVVSVPLNKLYEHDLGAMLSHCDASTGLVYICNPNNPTGTLTPHSDIEAFIGKLPSTAIVLIDEAYHHFAGGTAAYSSFLDRPMGDPRVMVTRTFSKIYGLAGLRVGYMVAPVELISRLSARRLTFGVGVISALAAAAALDDSDYVEVAARRNASDRQEFMNQVNARMMRAIDSHANFAMLDPRRPVQEVFEHLRKNNVLVAPPLPQMSKYLRVSLGTPSEMRRFWHVIDQMPGRRMVM